MGPTGQRPPGGRVLLGSALVGLASLIMFSDPDVLNGAWLLDDQGTVYRNPCLVEPDAPWSCIWQRDFWGRTDLSSPLSHKSWRPLTTLTFKLQWVDEETRFPYHVTNVLLHSLTSAMCVPVLCTLLYLLGFVIYGRAVLAARSGGRQGLGHYISLVGVMGCTFLSMLAKEHGITMPAVCLVWEVSRFTLFERSKGSLNSQTLLRIVVLVACSSVMATWRMSLNGDSAPDISCDQNPGSCHESILVRALTFSWLWCLSVWLLVWPRGM
eukprot:scaffold225_cov388-Prasinococcus_capsulatus_cf.AAC.3